MLEIGNEQIRIIAGEDGQSIVLTDGARRMSWMLDPATMTYRRYSQGDDACPAAPRRSIDAPTKSLGAGTATRRDTAIEFTYALPDGPVRMTWTLAPDHIKLILRCENDNIEFVTLPGAFVPLAGRHHLLLPIYQGVLFRGSDELWDTTIEPGGHDRIAMHMAAVVGDAGALLVTQESVTDWACTFGQGNKGPFVAFEQRRCPIDGWYEREVRLYPVKNDITSVCKRYRRRVIERGDFVGWDEKIAAKPIVEKLFGALIAFVGYNKTDQIDYVESARKLKGHGFDTVLYYSTRMGHYSLDFQMGGDSPIWLSDDQVQRLRAIPGTLLAPWAWIYEAPDDGSAQRQAIFRRDAKGRPCQHWQIDQQRWYEVCTPYQIEYIKGRLATDLGAMDWIHYDVAAMRPGIWCFSTDHAPHDHKPLTMRGDLEFTRQLLSPDTNGNRIVSSEGFADHYAGVYDIGSTKILPAWGDVSFIPVPMTMLVFHDSCVHDWWEVHNYNQHPGFAEPVNHRVGVNCCGHAETKAAMDALYGCPPNLFPFGKQYAWADIQTRKTYSYIVRIDDDQVHRAIQAALPVARLHKQIGRLELVSFEAVTEDYAVQTTVFADGMRIVANVSDQDRQTDALGLVPANSWRATQ